MLNIKPILLFLKAPKTTKYEPTKRNLYENSNSVKKVATHDEKIKDTKLIEQNDTSFFDILSRIQSNRLDDQRCSFRLVTNVNNNNDKSKRVAKKKCPLYNLFLLFRK